MQLTELLAFVIVPAVIMALIWVLVSARKWVKQKISIRFFAEMVERVTVAAESTVREFEQVFVKKAKEASADGKLTLEEIKQVSEDALQATKRNLGKHGLKIITGATGLREGPEMDAFIRGQNESALNRLKAEAPKA